MTKQEINFIKECYIASFSSRKKVFFFQCASFFIIVVLYELKPCSLDLLAKRVPHKFGHENALKMKSKNVIDFQISPFENKNIPAGSINNQIRDIFPNEWFQSFVRVFGLFFVSTKTNNWKLKKNKLSHSEMNGGNENLTSVSANPGQMLVTRKGVSTSSFLWCGGVRFLWNFRTTLFTSTLLWCPPQRTWWRCIRIHQDNLPILMWKYSGFKIGSAENVFFE